MMLPKEIQAQLDESDAKLDASLEDAAELAREIREVADHPDLLEHDIGRDFRRSARHTLRKLRPPTAPPLKDVSR